MRSVFERLPSNKKEEFARRADQITVAQGGISISALRDLGFNVGLSPEEATKQRNSLVKEFAQFAAPGGVKISPELQLQVLEQNNGDFHKDI